MCINVSTLITLSFVSHICTGQVNSFLCLPSTCLLIFLPVKHISLKGELVNVSSTKGSKLSKRQRENLSVGK